MLKKHRKYYRIGEVSRIVGVEPHVLRFWEKQFRHIKPRRISGQRLYRQQDLETIEYIKQLLYIEGFTIAGARKRLDSRAERQIERQSLDQRDVEGDILDEIREELREIHQILSGRKSSPGAG